MKLKCNYEGSNTFNPPYCLILVMVFGWGKKKTKKQEFETTSLKKEISLSQINDIVNDIKNLRTKTLIAEINSLQNYIIPQLVEILKIANELEQDDLKTDDIDKHLKTLVIRGKKQVISTIQNEVSTKPSKIKSVDDVLQYNIETTQMIKRVGDALGRQTRVIHIFAKKYAGKLKNNLSRLNSDKDEIQKLVNNYNKLENDASYILETLKKIEETNKTLEEKKIRIDELKNSIEKIKEKIESSKQEIKKFKETNEYSQFLEIKKKIEAFSKVQYQIKNEIDLQFTKISRPLNKYSYVSSLEKPQKLLMKTLTENPFKVLIPENKDDIIVILHSVRKSIESGSISVKDTSKSINQIDKTSEMLDDFIKKISEYNLKKKELEKDLGMFNVTELHQKESELDKAVSNKSSFESKIQYLDNEITDTNEKIPQIIRDLETKLRNISSTSYKITT